MKRWFADNFIVGFGVKEFVVTMEDLQEASRCLCHDKIERTRNGLFRGVVFCLLSIGQLYKSQLNTYRSLLTHELCSPEAVRDKLGLAKLITSTARFPSATFDYLMCLAMTWDEHEKFFVETFINNFPNDSQVIEVREELIKRVKGFGYKVASLFMCLLGLNVPAIDIWLLRFLKEQGYPVSYNYERDGGIDRKQYLKYEKYLKDFANKYGLPVGVFQVIVWVKMSSWNKQADLKQLELFG
jgi:thermostable 8-oxoguanine DNA glycosylase